jgi:hypothetical protein
MYPDMAEQVTTTQALIMGVAPSKGFVCMLVDLSLAFRSYFFFSFPRFCAEIIPFGLVAPNNSQQRTEYMW